SAAPAPAQRRAALHRPARIFIAILRTAAPDQFRFFSRFDLEGPQQVRDASLVGDQREIFAKLDPGESLLSLEHFHGLVFKWRFDSDDLVAMRNFLLRIAAVHGFHPENGGRIIRRPADDAWASLNATHWNAGRQRQTGDLIG